ncbi:MAG: LLM class F420-dependent oxidoreductase [Pseudorhodobacter sp.]|nr:LLM class F420-dependent oxidoreductase [Frankiaceae bacterium]
MELRIFTEPQQGATYDDLLRVALHAERLGFDAFFRSDHFLTMGGDGLPGPTDAWITLAGLARDTSTIRLGTLVSAATFRLPGPLAVAVAQVDQMSGGRVELGLGTGWFDAEHTAYGIPFPPLGERFERFEEQLAILAGLWTSQGPFSHAGKHYRLADCPALARPTQSPLPLVVGGGGTTRTPRLAATFATEFNMPFASVQETTEQFGRVRQACAVTGRELVLSAAQVLCVGRDEAELAQRAAALGRDVAELRANGLAGTPAEVIEKARAFGAAGATRLYLQVMDLHDLEHLDLVAAAVMPHL